MTPPRPAYKAPFYSRGKFSPRLLAAWLVAVYTVRIIEHWLGAKAYLVGTMLVQPTDLLGLVIALLGVFTTLFGLGTVQTTVLGDAAPAPGLTGESGAVKAEGDQHQEDTP